MALRETENNTYANFWGDKQRALWYVMIFSGVVNSLAGGRGGGGGVGGRGLVDLGRSDRGFPLLLPLSRALI